MNRIDAVKLAIKLLEAGKLVEVEEILNKILSGEYTK